MTPADLLPPRVRVLERGWLSANNVVFHGPGTTSVVDTGYASHAAQTVRLVATALQGSPLALIVNTHLHSDHCGGNAALQAAHPGVATFIPPGLAHAVRDWDPVALTYAPTGQECPPFAISGTLVAGDGITLGDRSWQVHAAPGHDPHSVVLFDPMSGTLLSADALWENGFGVVFQELEGERAFDEVAATLDVIERLAPTVVVPGHGAVFTDVGGALARARRRLDGFARDPHKHARHATKVLFKFKLLDAQRVERPALLAWARATPYFPLVHKRWFADMPFDAWMEDIVADLVRSGAAVDDGTSIANA